MCVFVGKDEDHPSESYLPREGGGGMVKTYTYMMTIVYSVI